MTTEDKIKAFADLFEKEQNERMDAQGFSHHRDPDRAIIGRQGSFTAQIISGRKYTKVDFNGSGWYMVENATEKIFGIKAYGVIHRGHYYGKLDEIHAWNWGEYQAQPKAS